MSALRGAVPVFGMAGFAAAVSGHVPVVAVDRLWSVIGRARIRVLGRSARVAAVPPVG
jgi:hypothetical protein